MIDQVGLLRCIAEAGYNVGFGAKKHFATFDMAGKVPGWISFLSFAVGIAGLVYEPLSSKEPSATLAILGVAGLYMSLYRGSEYEAAGKELTVAFKQLRNLYWSVKGGCDLSTAEAELRALETKSDEVAISRQIALSGWYAHYKFFAEQQIDWIDEQLHFSWRDKVPLSARVVGAFLIAVFIAGAALWFV